MPKELTKALPRNRPFGIIEAMFSYQVDVDNNQVKSERQYAHIWNWSRTRVHNFFNGSIVNSKSHRGATKEPLKVRIIKPDSIQKASKEPLESHYYKTDYIYIVEYLNEKALKNFKSITPKTISLIHARLKEGFDKDDFKKVIDNKVVQWLDDPKMNLFLRPETLFGNKFEGYLNNNQIRKDELVY